MTEFSATWLHLREPVDRRSRNAAVANALLAELASIAAPKVVDLGCGTGANLRAIAPLLGRAQDWTLVDNDPALLKCAMETLGMWADAVVRMPDGLTLDKAGSRIRVWFRQADVAADLAGILNCAVDLVTASAFFDLVSPGFIEAIAAATVERRAVFHTSLTFDGTQRWTPASDADEQVCRAFEAHQARDKGFGPAAGSRATALLAGAFEAAGYRVTTGDSPWRLGAADDALMRQLDDGIDTAVTETGLVDPDTMAIWRACDRTGMSVGHRDMLASPPRR